ncbi:MAG: alkaline phosphatase D family protein [Sandaracinus sp.]|nr:alkaline phosphatase D family protein [Sandaracinus sp.]
MDRDDERRALTRRELLRLAGAGATTALLACGDDDMSADASLGDGGANDASPEDASTEDANTEDAGTDAGERPAGDPESLVESDAFGLGVASGDVREDGAVLWTRYDGSDALRVRVWRMDGETYAALVYEADVTTADGGFVHVDVPLPQAGARYRYAFVEGDGDATQRSPIGRFRAAFEATTLAPLVIGAVSCTRNGRTFGTLERAGMRDDLDAFLLLGDTTYADGAVSLADYRGKWAENLATPGYRALRAATSVYASWDDHEIDNNWDPETIAPAQFRAALDAFFEHTPARRLSESPDRIWRSARWGQTLELFVLDCRSERRPSTRRADDATYVSAEQLAWLQRGLSESTAVFKVVMNSVGISDFPLLLDAGSNDRWEGYPAQRDALLRFLDEASIPGLLWIAGDFHFACLGHVGRDEAALGWNQWEVLVGPGAQVGNPLSSSCRPPQFPFATRENNYTDLAFDPTSGEVTIRWIDAAGAAFATQTIRP